MKFKSSKKTRRIFSIIGISIFAILSLIMANIFLKDSTEYRSKAAAPGETRYLDKVFNFVKITTDISYAQALNYNNQMQTLHLDLYQPSGDSETQRPAIVWLHGGSFIRGSPVQAYVIGFAKRGYVAAAIDYRLVDLATRNAQLAGFKENPSTLPPFLLNAQHDALAAVRWFRANASEYNIDPDRIIVGGSSAGAIAALYTAYNYEDAGNSGNPGYSSKVSAVVSAMGGMYAPEIWIKPNDPPAGMFIGDLDPFYQYALDTKAVLEQLSIPVTMGVFPNKSHVLKGDLLNPLIARFLYDQLFLNAPLPSTPPPPLPPTPTPQPTTTTSPMPTTPPQLLPSPQSPQYSQDDIEFSCRLINKYTNLETYTGTAKEKQKLQRLINFATKTGRNKVNITNVDQLLEFYNTYCN